MALKGNGRREFLLKSGAALAATSVSWSASSYASILGANDRFRVGVVGCGDRMKRLDPGVSGERTKAQLRIGRGFRYLESAARRRCRLYSKAERKARCLRAQQRRIVCSQGH